MMILVLAADHPFLYVEAACLHISVINCATLASGQMSWYGDKILLLHYLIVFLMVHLGWHVLHSVTVVTIVIVRMLLPFPLSLVVCIRCYTVMVSSLLSSAGRT